MEEGEGKNGELIWLWETFTSCCVLSGDLCALARAIHRYGTGKQVGSAVAANLGAAQRSGSSLDVGTSGTRSGNVAQPSYTQKVQSWLSSPIIIPT
jgi:hypothetical protein